MAKHGENIYKRKDGRWEGRYKDGYRADGKTKYSSIYGKSYSDVKKKLLLKNSQNTVSNPCRCIFNDLIDYWLANIKNNVKESTYSNYSMKIEKHIRPFLGNIRYEDMTSGMLNEFILYKQSCGLSSKYTADIVVLIKSIAKYAHKTLGYADKTLTCSLPKDKCISESKILSSSDYCKLISLLLRNATPSNIGILLSASTGMRIGEICALKWSDIDLERKVIVVNKTLQRIKNNDGISATKIIITSPKSRTSSREIPLPDIVMPILSENSKDDNCYVITGTERYSEPRAMQYRFRNFIKESGLPLVNFHSLRHTFATQCIAVGFDVKTLSEILGHGSVEITLNRYVHSSLDRKRSCFELLSKSIKPSNLPSEMLSCNDNNTV